MGESDFFNTEATRQILEAQWKRPEVVGTGRNRIEIIDLTPPHLKTEVPAILVPGWSATAQVLKENVISLASSGRRVIVASAPHGVDTDSQQQFPQAEMRKTEALMQTLDHKHLDRVDAISHSEASLFMTMGAVMRHDLFRNFVLVSPVGLIGKDTLGRLTKDSMKEISGQTIKALFSDQSRIGKMLRAYAAFGASIAGNPILTYHEIAAIASYRIEDILQELKSRGHKISIIHTGNDKALPMERMQRIVDRTMVDGFASVSGSHNEVYLKPKGMTKLIDHLLDAMEKK